MLDPFKPPGMPDTKSSLTYELMNIENMILESGGGLFSVDPANPGNHPTQGVWWWLASRGPDKQFGFRPSEKEYNIQQRFFESDEHPEHFTILLYDPTNGTISTGNIFRTGGQAQSTAVHLIQLTR